MEEAAFAGHPVWAALSDLEGMIGEVSERGGEAVAVPLAQLRYLAAAIRAHRDAADSGPYTATAFSNLQGALGLVLQELRNYLSNGNPGHLANAQTHADAALYHVGLWPAAALKGGAAAQANKTFSEYRDAAEAALQQAQAMIDTLRTQIDQQRRDSDAAVNALREQIDGLSAKVAQDAARLDTALVTNNEAFTAKQTEREERFREWLDQQGESLRELASSDLVAVNGFRIAAEAAFAEIDQLRDDTKTVAGIAAGDQVGRGYKGYAFRQWFAGLIAYVVGFLAIATGATVVVETIRGIKPSDTITWQFALLKLGLTASVVFAAVIAFRLGSQLLAEASTAKRFELELKALGPLFPHDDERELLKTVKKDLVERSFGHGWLTSGDGNESGDEHVLERLAELIGRIVLRPPTTGA